MNKQANYGGFDVTGIVKGLGTDSITLDSKGKNNVNWIMNVLNLRLEDNHGGSFFMNIRDGYDAVKGKKIYSKTKDGKNIEIPFSDRMNETLLEQIDEKKTIRLGYAIAELEKDGKKYNGWVYKNFLTEYDLVRYLKDTLENGMKVTFSGNVSYSLYNGDVQQQYSVQRVYIEPKQLPEDWKPMELGFNFRQTFLVDENSVEDSEFSETGITNVNAYIYTLENKRDANNKIVKVKGEDGNLVNVKIPKVYPVKYVIRATEEKRELTKRVIDSYLKVDGDTVRKITFLGKFVQGLVGGTITEDELSDEIKEMIELELYTLEEALKMNATKDRVKEQQLTKPNIIKTEGKLSSDIDDTTYTKEDLAFTIESEDEEVFIKDETPDSEDDLLAELDNL